MRALQASSRPLAFPVPPWPSIRPTAQKTTANANGPYGVKAVNNTWLVDWGRMCCVVTLNIHVLCCVGQVSLIKFQGNERVLIACLNPAV